MTTTGPRTTGRTAGQAAVLPTCRQLQVLSGVARGYKNVEIAGHLHVARPTVQRHVDRLGKSLGTSERARMVAIGYERGWLARLSPEPREWVVLTGRCQDVLRLIAEGKSNEEIADGLHLSVNTVKSHVRRILDVLQARHRAHAVALAYQHGHLRRRPDPHPAHPVPAARAA
ncbi:helix-turn-helix transcriptional regulator [Streptomyces sp. SID8352]|uniref:LuxR C-terminal-related transcriptional regulator n=1 Tax=unclassified Streptomyces TaxID=2593676 RepID=UPI00136E408E|nr:LuxR family transcriptional regulator [Streptomyces sp. SID8352]